MPSLRRAGAALAVLRRVVISPRFVVYTFCALLAVVTAHWLGKDMQWDTLDYHLYAGFSALHDRFGLDYFAAGPQSYLNPYAYAPFYLLVTSGLSALEVAAILALVQSGILCLTYEVAVAVAPPSRPGMRISVGVCAALLAFANPVLIEQFGSSFADITTAELVLAGSLLLIRAMYAPGPGRMLAAGCLLGAASALKLTNSLPAVALAIMPLFLPVRWPKRLGAAGLYGLSVGLSFVLVSLPWSIKLQRHFGNPLFPLFNGVFRSPEFTTARIVDFRFIPTSFGEALWRPFAMMAPGELVHFERPAPDARYALLVVLAVLLVLTRWLSRLRSGQMPVEKPGRSAKSRALLALGCAFLFAWVLWLAESGNSRYFIPMACVAAALVMALTCSLLTAWPRVFACVFAVLLGTQFHQVWGSTVFRPPYPWAGEQWFDVSMPHSLAPQPALYFSVGAQSSSFVVPYLPARSAFVNLEGLYVLGPEGANGAHIRKLITQYSPHLRVLVLDSRVDAASAHDVPHLSNVDDAVEPFGLRVDVSSCSRILARAAPKLGVVTVERALPMLPRSAWYTRYLVTCRLVPDGGRRQALASIARTADLVLDRLEDACPALFQPRRPETYLVGSDAGSYSWVRRYTNTDVMAWVHRGRVTFQKMIGTHRVQDVGSVSAWERSSFRVVCARQSDDDFLRILPPVR